MQDGIVKFYNSTKAPGSFSQRMVQVTSLVHASALERAGLGPLAEGDKMSFDTEVDRRNGKTCVGNIQMA